MIETHVGRRLAVLGAGGHGRVVADSASAMQMWDAIAFYDDRWPTVTSNGPWVVSGTFEQFFARSTEDLFVGIGDGIVRMALLDQAVAAKRTVATIIHPRAIVSSHAFIDVGSVIMPGAVVNIGARVSRGAIINTGATVDHDCLVGAGVHIAPGAHLSGNVEVGDLSWIGLGSCIRQGVRVGERCMVGAGAAVVADVACGTTVMGVPARARHGSSSAPR